MLSRYVDIMIPGKEDIFLFSNDRVQRLNILRYLGIIYFWDPGYQIGVHKIL
jgi:hypothetical protein